MIVNFVNGQKMFGYKEKYSHIKFIRSQMSAYEQSIFFYNSLCFLGRIWEIDADANKEPPRDILNKRLITKYDLVKNISAELIADIDLQNIYPLVEFEIGEKKPEKERLKKKYT
jgi:hypothetical protein